MCVQLAAPQDQASMSTDFLGRLRHTSQAIPLRGALYPRCRCALWEAVWKLLRRAICAKVTQLGPCRCPKGHPVRGHTEPNRRPSDAPLPAVEGRTPRFQVLAGRQPLAVHHSETSDCAVRYGRVSEPCRHCLQAPSKPDWSVHRKGVRNAPRAAVHRRRTAVRSGLVEARQSRAAAVPVSKRIELCQGLDCLTCQIKFRFGCR